MKVEGIKQTVDIESEMSGYSVGFGNVFNPFVTGAVASALPTYSNFDSDGKQHLERRTASVLNFNSANIKTVDLELHHGIINADNLNLEVERNLVIEHLKEANTSWNNSHSFGINFGAMMSFGVTPGLINGTMATPVIRNEKGYSIEETISKSGIYAKEKTARICKVIEIIPTIRNEEKISVFDTAPISSIGSMMSCVQEINILLNKIKKDAEQRHIHDAKVEQVIEDVKQITDKSDGKTVEMQDKLDAIENKTKHAINENIYLKFLRIYLKRGRRFI